MLWRRPRRCLVSLSPRMLEEESLGSLTDPRDGILPRWLTPRSPGRLSFGPVVAEVSAALGRPFMPHQRAAMDVFLEVQSGEDPEPGEWAYDDNAETIQRRAGKTAQIQPLVIHRMRSLDMARCFLTAQNRDKARSRFLEAAEPLSRSVLGDDLALKTGNMNELLTWKANGSTFAPFAPNEGAIDGEDPDLVIVDELWKFTAEQRRLLEASYVPALGTSGGQAFKFSTKGTERSAWLNGVVRSGRRAVESGVRLGTAYAEWGLPDRVGGKLLEELSDAEIVDACVAWHPAVCHVPDCRGAGGRRPCPHGFTVRSAAIRSAWVTMTAENLEDGRAEFLRAYGNRTPGDAATGWRGVSEQTYLARLDKTGIPESARVALGVAVDPESRDAAVSAGWRDDAGRMHVEVVRADVGTRWVAPFVAGVVERQRPARVAIGNVKAARDVADQLEAGGLEILKVSQADVSAASVRHRDELEAGTWWHRVVPELTDSARHVEFVAGGWRAGPSGPVSAWVSCTMAGWAMDHAPAETSFWMG